MDSATHRNVFERQTVAVFNWGFLAAFNALANLHVFGGQNVVVGAVRLFNTGDTGAAVRVVFDVLDGCLDATRQVEVHQAVKTTHPAALVTGGDAPLVVAAVLGTLRYQQRAQWLFGGNFSRILAGHTAPAGSRWLV